MGFNATSTHGNRPAALQKHGGEPSRTARSWTEIPSHVTIISSAGPSGSAEPHPASRADEPEHRHESLHCDLIVCLFSNHPFVPARERAAGQLHLTDPPDRLFRLVLEPRRPSPLHNGTGRRAEIRIRKSMSETRPTCTCA